MYPDEHDIQSFSIISDENEKLEISISNSHFSKRKVDLSRSNLIVTIESNVASYKSRDVTDYDSYTAIPETMKGLRTHGEDKGVLEYEYGGSSKHSPLSKNCQNSTPRVPLKEIDTLNLSLNASQQTDVLQDTNIKDTPTKRRYPSSDDGSESQPDSKKYIILSELNQKADFYKEISSIWSNLLFIPGIDIKEKFEKEFDSLISEECRENLQLLAPRFEFATDAGPQSAVDEHRKFGKLEPRTSFQADSSILKDVNRTPIFKIPKERARRTKSVNAKTLSKSRTRQKNAKSFKNSKLEAAEKMEFQQSQIQNGSFKNEPLNMMLSNENGLYAMFESVLDVKNSDASALKDTAMKFSRSRNDTEHVSQSRNNTRDVSRSRSDTGHVSRSRSDTGHVSRSRSDTGHVSRSRSDTGHVSRSRSDTGHVSRSRSDTGHVSRSRSDTGHLSQSRNNTGDVSRSDNGHPSLVDQRQEEYLSSLAADSKRAENFISRRLEALENQIHHCYSELNAIPPWSPRLVTVLCSLARRRSLEACNYLAVRYKSERRRSLFEIRELFINILETLVGGMIEILDDVRYAFSDGNIRVDHSIIDETTSFWANIVADYKELRAIFYNIRADYPNFDDVCKSMDEHYTNIREIFFAFHEGVIDLFESF